MYETIQLSEVIFGMHILSLSNSKNSLVSVNKPNLQKTSKSAVLDLYQEQFEELYQLVVNYNALLEKDIAQFAETGQELKQTDQGLGHVLSGLTLLGGR
ncbi:hypothetical protein HMPREF3103_01135 [Granulicatella sp. HMSC30F09]|jgi:hypothetical protein|uniref:TIGR04197 family type VII secretion effector n=1 Tax=Granulicatella sp. HMSC30F09 TaxID=1581071 RepID=UPI0008A4D4A4|nr:TIGR04197 family type VII secretion effector [Granulicatella sp. HMSC30F09]OFT81414.1 hypothetical protein HMPREF3103_01135 [Granulicatella sp. HMSC30F09]